MLAKGIPAHLLHTADWVSNVIFIVALVVVCVLAFFGQPVGEALTQQNLGISPWWILVFIALVVLWELLRANYQHVATLESQIAVGKAAATVYIDPNEPILDIVEVSTLGLSLYEAEERVGVGRPVKAYIKHMGDSGAAFTITFEHCEDASGGKTISGKINSLQAGEESAPYYFVNKDGEVVVRYRRNGAALEVWKEIVPDNRLPRLGELNLRVIE